MQPSSMPACPNCLQKGLQPFYRVGNIPVHSVLKIRTREEALRFPTGDLHLAFCPSCGFITNTAFDGRLLNYSREYEETQGFSPTFSAFHRRLARELMERHQLYGKDIIEIGSGKGEFLTLLCELGGNRGIGFDPAFVPERRPSSTARVTFIEDFYSEKYAHYHADFICCKMTLEHIPDTAHFVGTVRRAIGRHLDTTIFFQIPDVRRILQERAFWDLYYEHCSYFSPASLRYLFESQGFNVLRIWTDYDDQYLMLEAKPATAPRLPVVTSEELEALKREVDAFATHIHESLHAWKETLTRLFRAGKRTVLWGGGSKAVAFLTTLRVEEEVTAAVDINPYKRGTFLAGTGHEVVAPDDLVEEAPDVVIVMNPIYHEEIVRMLHALQLYPVVIDVTAPVEQRVALSHV